MLRLLLLLLITANLGFYSWTQGWLDGVVGIRATGDREPERLARQLRPEAVVILPPESEASSSAAATAAPACLEAGPFSPTELVAAITSLKQLLPTAAEGGWAEVKTELPGSWIVYMGKFPDAEGLAKKEQELKRLKLDFELVRSPPALDRGVSLGRFDQRAAADKALERFTQQGVRTARVVELSPPGNASMLRAARADSALANQLVALKAASLGKGFAACAKAP
ncbi:MAG: SPOR domain-containing protein [Burkholderiales bacterium]